MRKIFARFAPCLALGCATLLAGTPAYTIHTFAGSDLVGDNGPASAAYVSILEGVCGDAAGNIYVADADDNRVRKIDPAGIVTTYAGTGFAGFGGDGGPAAQAALRSPFGIRLDARGNLFIADLGNGRVRRVGTDGNITTVASGLNQPRNVALDASGTLYVAEFGANQVSRIDGDGKAALFAGNGTAGFSGDGGPAQDAQLNAPAGLAFDSAGALYIADSANERIRRVTPDGTISTFLGGVSTASGTNFPLIAPTGLAADSAGNLYVASSGYPATFRIDPSGRPYALAGVGRDIFPAANGDVLLAGQQHLEQVHANGSVTTLFSNAAYSYGDGGPAVNARFEAIAGVAVDPVGNVVISDAAFRRLRQVAPDGTIESLQASDYVTTPRSLAFDPAGRLFVADGALIKIAAATGTAAVFSAGLTAPAGLAFTASGTLYFTDGGGVFSTDSSGLPTALAASPPLQAPNGLAVDASGFLYVADTAGQVVRKFNADGSTINIAGTGAAGFGGDGGPATQAVLNAPTGIAFDGAGNLWIADTGNNRVRFVDTAGVIHNAAGTGISGFSGDGAGAQDAQIGSPTSIACDSKGNVFFVDSGNRRVRELTLGVSAPRPEPVPLTITHAATFATGPIAGGEIVSLFGENLGPAIAVTATLDGDGKVSTTLGDTQVLVNGIPAPLYYVQDLQINAQLPVETAGHLSVLVEVRRSGVAQASVVADVAPYIPGLFEAAPFAAALNYPDYTLNGPEHPAAAGSVILLFGTGFGTTSPLETTGRPATAPFGVPDAVVSVFIGGTQAKLLYVGDAPGFAGLTQLNAVIPNGTPPGKAQVQVSTANVVSPAGVYIQVR